MIDKDTKLHNAACNFRHYLHIALCNFSHHLAISGLSLRRPPKLLRAFRLAPEGCDRFLPVWR